MMAGSCGRGHSHHDGQEDKTEYRTEPGQYGTLPTTGALPPTFHPIPVMPSYWKATQGLTHLDGLSPHDPVVPENNLTDTPRSVLPKYPSCL